MSAENIALCVKALSKTFTKNGYSNIVLDSFLKFENCDKRFCTALYYGVIERKITLDYIISQYSSKKLEKIDEKVLEVLRCGIYQLKFMNVPQNIAVNDCVNAVKLIGFTSAKAFVNAVLRSFIRAGCDFPIVLDMRHSFSIQYSAPIWLVDKWRSEYPDDFVSLLQSTVSSPKTTVKLNTAKFNRNDIISRLRNDGIEFEESRILDDCLYLNSGDYFNSQSFLSGMFYVQDISSQLCAMALGAFEGATVIDVCAAPGGKTFSIAQMMNDSGKIYACDLHQKRVGLIEQGAQRLNLTCIDFLQNDASKFNPQLPMADFVLCDAVCSGLGVISKKPEIKYKNEADFEKLPEIQKNILDCSAKYVKKGGYLMYSTCTLSKAENEEVADAFLKKNPEFTAVTFLEKFGGPFGKPFVTILPKHFSSDGFFMAKFKRM